MAVTFPPSVLSRTRDVVSIGESQLLQSFESGLGVLPVVSGVGIELGFSLSVHGFAERSVDHLYRRSRQSNGDHVTGGVVE